MVILKSALLLLAYAVASIGLLLLGAFGDLLEGPDHLGVHALATAGIAWAGRRLGLPLESTFYIFVPASAAAFALSRFTGLILSSVWLCRGAGIPLDISATEAAIVSGARLLPLVVAADAAIYAAAVTWRRGAAVEAGPAGEPASR